MKNEIELNHQFKKIIDQHKGILFRIARTYCKNENDWQDLIQEMTIQIWRSLSKYNNQFAVSTWVYRIALNVAISFYRKNRRGDHSYVPLSDHISAIDEEQDFERKEQLNLLEQFICDLNDLDKALMLLYLDDKSHAEIAEVLGISVSNVSTKVARIREKLKKRFLQKNL